MAEAGQGSPWAGARSGSPPGAGRRDPRGCGTGGLAGRRPNHVPDLRLQLLQRPPILMQVGDSVKIPVGHMHRMTNKTKENLVFIEVQTGTYFGEDDIVRFSDDYGREFTHPTMIKFQEDNAMGIEITEGTTTLLIGILRDHIYKHTGDEHSDKATHPIEVNLLDMLIEKRENFRGNYYPGYAEGTSHVKPESWLTDSANWEAQDLAEEDE